MRTLLTLGFLAATAAGLWFVFRDKGDGGNDGGDDDGNNEPANLSLTNGVFVVE